MAQRRCKEPGCIIASAPSPALFHYMSVVKLKINCLLKSLPSTCIARWGGGCSRVFDGGGFWYSFTLHGAAKRKGARSLAQTMRNRAMEAGSQLGVNDKAARNLSLPTAPFSPPIRVRIHAVPRVLPFLPVPALSARKSLKQST